jgi:type II secretory pathway pseudopilin PulG
MYAYASTVDVCPLARIRGEEGMSLVEATIVLMVIFMLSAVLAPNVGDYIEDARHIKGKEDAEAIGVTIIRLQRDIGQCLKIDASDADGCDMANRVDILRTSGPDVVASDLGSSAVAFTATNNITGNTINWDDDQDAGVGDTMENQFVLNNPDYATPAETTPFGYTLSGPVAGLGWRGAYITTPVGTDPWGKVYLSNTVFLVVANDAVDGDGEGERRGGWSHDTIVVSAGPNNLFDTPFGGSANFGTERASDDIIYIVRGDTR